MGKIEGTTWPEQDAIDKWFREHGLDNFPNSAIMELKRSVTIHRLKLQVALEKCATVLEEVQNDAKSDSAEMWDRVDHAVQKARELV